MKKFTSKGIEVTQETIVKRKAYTFRTSTPKKFKFVIGKIETLWFNESEVIVNCGGQSVTPDGRIYIPKDVIKLLELTHDSVLVWKLSYTSTGIKITVGGKK